tara:strand:+ start:281 stop:697 length:417 start_codon:yes stop_codon:yes gene_type:complete
MKSKDVPQDDANMLQGKFKEPVYSLDENGNYVTVSSVGWDPKNAVMQEAWDIVNEKVELARQKVLSGKLSPIAYYIEKNIMDTGLVAKYMGIRKWKVKKHLNPKNFAKLNDDMLEKYAKVFSISREELVDIKLLSKVV